MICGKGLGGKDVAIVPPDTAASPLLVLVAARPGATAVSAPCATGGLRVPLVTLPRVAVVLSRCWFVCIAVCAGRCESWRDGPGQGGHGQCLGEASHVVVCGSRCAGPACGGAWPARTFRLSPSKAFRPRARRWSRLRRELLGRPVLSQLVGVFRRPLSASLGAARSGAHYPSTSVGPNARSLLNANELGLGVSAGWDISLMRRNILGSAWSLQAEYLGLDDWNAGRGVECSEPGIFIWFVHVFYYNLQARGRFRVLPFRPPQRRAQRLAAHRRLGIVAPRLSLRRSEREQPGHVHNGRRSAAEPGCVSRRCQQQPQRLSSGLRPPPLVAQLLVAGGLRQGGHLRQPRQQQRRPDANRSVVCLLRNDRSCGLCRRSMLMAKYSC